MPLDKPDDCAIPLCPICGSALTLAHDHAKLKICVCRICGTSLSIPDDAWLRARMFAATQKIK